MMFIMKDVWTCSRWLSRLILQLLIRSSVTWFQLVGLFGLFCCCIRDPGLLPCLAKPLRQNVTGVTVLPSPVLSANLIIHSWLLSARSHTAQAFLFLMQS